MHGIYFTALLTTALAVGIFGTTIHRLRLPADERLLWLAALIVVPLQPLAFYCVRMPLDHWLVAHLGSASTTYRWLTSLYAPLTEEPCKLVPLLIPAIYRDVRATNFVRYALAIGLGFAIGEIWFVAEQITRVPALAGLPFYQFTGYAVERLMTCVFHSAFVCVALWQLRRAFASGVACAMVLHWLGNFPLLLMAWNVGGSGKTVWMMIVQGWLIIYLVAALLMLSCFLFDWVPPARRIYGVRHCPECDRDYDPSFFALNFGLTRYERCPHCRRWHLTKGQKPPKLV